MSGHAPPPRSSPTHECCSSGLEDEIARLASRRNRRPLCAQLLSIHWLLVVLLPSVARAKLSGAGGDEHVERQTHHAVKLHGERNGFETARIRSLLNAPLEVVEDDGDSTLSGENVEREWLVHLKGPICQDLRVQLSRALGVEHDALTYVPSNTFLVVSTHARVQAAKTAVQNVLWAGHVLPHHKVSPELYPVILGEPSSARAFDTSPRRSPEPEQEADKDAVELAVSLAAHTHDRASSIGTKWASQLGCSFSSSSPSPSPSSSSSAAAGGTNASSNRKQQACSIHIASPSKVLLRVRDRVSVTGVIHFLSKQHATSWIQPRERFRLQNRWVTGVVQSGTLTRTPLWDRGLRGEKQIIGTADTGPEAAPDPNPNPQLPTPNPQNHIPIFSPLHRRHRPGRRARPQLRPLTPNS
jgi:hypothetical protein